MPYNSDGSHKKNPTKQDWAAYHLRKGTKKKASGSKSAPGAAIGGGAAAGGGS